MRGAWVVVGLAMALAAGPVEASSATQPDPAWTTPIRDLEAGESVLWTDVAGEFAEPVGIVDGVVVARWSGTITSPSSESGRALVAGVDLGTGDLLWSIRLEPYVGWPVIAADGTVVVGADDGRSLVALDPATGERVWSRTMTSVEHLAAGDGVVVAAGKRSLEGIAPADGALQWSLDLKVGGLLGDPEGVWVWDEDALRLSLRDPATGDEVRAVVLPEGAADVQAIVGDIAYVTGWPAQQWWTDGVVAAVDLTGVVLWARPVMPRDCRGAEGCMPRGISLVTDGQVVAIRTLVERAEAEPCPIGCAYGRSILMLDAASGDTVWTVDLEKDWEGGPGLEIAGDRLAATDGHLRTYRIADGRQVWSIPAPASPEGVGAGERFSGSSVVSDDGRLVVGTWAGSLVAYDLPGWTPPATPTPTISPTAQPSVAPSPTPSGTAEPDEGPPLLPLAAGAAILVAAAIVGVAYRRRRGRAGPVR